MEKVELVYISQDKQIFQRYFEFKNQLSVADVLRESNLWTSHPETKDYLVGIYGKTVSLDTLLQAGDRIEIYRPLHSDPKEKRRQKAR